jgi:hypothetical protein
MVGRGMPYLNVWIKVFAIAEDFDYGKAVVGCGPVDGKSVIVVA